MLKEELDELKKQNEMYETRLNLKAILEHNLTMENWDKFTIILQENKMQEFLNKIYMHRNLAVAKAKDMKEIILQSAEDWKI